MKKPYFTIFTPVYNAEKHLNKVFQSVLYQTFQDFEWIIINDGSTDGSDDSIKKFITQNPHINTTYISQTNQGKHVAWNKAVELAQGKLFVPADADDFFVDNTLMFFHDRWEGIDNISKAKLSGINVLCYDNDTNKILGDQFPRDEMLSTSLELFYKFKVKGEKWGCVRVDLLKQRPFPILKDSYFPESYLWFYFAKSYQAVCYNTALRKYYTNESGISNSSQNLTEYQLNMLIIYYKWFLSNFFIYLLVNSPIWLIKYIMLLIYYLIIFAFRSLKFKINL
jgi:glycosyltransferase involved in cell wall biosynthesis